MDVPQVYTQKASYSGCFQNGLFAGYGNLKSSCMSYNGEFKKGEFHGRGKSIQKKYFYTPAQVYEGSFENGLYSGYGQLSFENGSYYNGLFNNGYFVGGMVFIDGKNYVGTVRREIVSYEFRDEEMLLINIDNVDYEILFDEECLDSYEMGPICLRRSCINDI